MAKQKLEEGDVVLCTVKRIQGTTVFVDIENNEEGTIIVSEIAPGRIRNLRDYVVPGKKIACKILKIDKNNINLSLRRVKEKEKKQVMEQYQREKSSLSILKSVLENAEKIADKIKEKENNLYSFLQKAKQKPEFLKKYINKKQAEKILKILKERKEKKVTIKKEFSLKSKKENGLTVIKKILKSHQDKITYLSASHFLLKFKEKNYKQGNKQAEKILKEIENKTGEKADFEILK